MRPSHPHQDRPDRGRAWFALPASIFAALVAALVIVSWPDAAGSPGSLAEALAVLPDAGSGAYPVPSAASVFTERRHEVSDPLDTF